MPVHFQWKLNESKHAKELTDFQRKYNEVVDSINAFASIHNKLAVFSYASDVLANGAGRFLGSIILSKIHDLKDFCFKSYETLYNDCVVHLMDFSSNVLGGGGINILSDGQPAKPGDAIHLRST